MANAVSYKNPATGATPPTAAQSRIHQTLVALITGDNAATSFVITHNWGLTTAQLTQLFAPWPTFVPLLAAFWGSNPFISARDANTVTFTCVAFTGAAMDVVLARPFSMLQ